MQGTGPGDAEQVDPLPRWLGWVAWGIGALALYSLLLGRATMDALDAEYPVRDEVRTNANGGRPLLVEVGSDAEESAEVSDALSVLPEMLTILADQKKIRIFLTTLDAIAERGIEPGLPVSHVAGYFSRKDWQLHIAHDSERPGMVALHEYGHFVDATFEDCSASPAFDPVFKMAADKGELGQYYVGSAAEMFAYMFAQHFFSDRRRLRLEKDYPEGAAFMVSLASAGACPGVGTTQ
jgi:hypothetical protein